MKHGRRQRDKARWPSRKWLKYSAAIPHRCGRRDSQREGWLLYYKPFLLLFFLWIISWRRLIFFLNICCVRLCVWDEEGRTKKLNVFFLGKKKFSLKSLLSHSAWLLCWSVVKVTQAAVLHVKSENVHCQHYCHFPPIETRLMFRFQTSVKDSRILFFMLFFFFFLNQRGCKEWRRSWKRGKGGVRFVIISISCAGCAGCEECKMHLQTKKAEKTDC